VPLSNRELRTQLRRHDCVLVGADLLIRFPALASTDLPLAVDLYDVVPLEVAELFRDSPPAVLDAALRAAAAGLRLELSRADVVFCSSERQRELWVGGMLAMGRLTAGAYEADPTLGGLCRLVPFGVAAGRPERGAPALRQAVDGIGEGDRVALW